MLPEEANGQENNARQLDIAVLRALEWRIEPQPDTGFSRCPERLQARRFLVRLCHTRCLHVGGLAAALSQ